MRRSATECGARGFTLVEIMIAMGLLAGLSLGIASLMTQMNKANLRTTLLATAQTIRGNIQEMVRNERAWSSTLNDKDNETFKCLQTLSDCSAAKSPDPNRSFQVHDATGTVYYAGLLPGAGFTRNGSACADYPSKQCVLRAQVSWQALCPVSGLCILPQVSVQGKVLYTPGSPDGAFAYNPENYGFNIIKSLSSDELGAVNIPSPTPGAPPAPAPPPPPAPPPAAPAAATPPIIDFKATCAIMGSQLNNPNFVAMMAAQLKGMGYEGDTDEMIKNLQQKCASENATP